MDAYESLRTSLASAFSQIGTQLAEYAPKLLGAALLLLLGWLIARLLRGLAVKVMHLLELVLHRLWRGPAGRAALLPSASVEVVGTILFWVVIVFFAAAATHVLGLDAFSSWLTARTAASCSPSPSGRGGCRARPPPLPSRPSSVLPPLARNGASTRTGPP